MYMFLVLLGLLINGDFAQGLAHWHADPGWSVERQVAQLNVDNRAGAGTRGADLCSEAVALNGAPRVNGAADVWAKRTANGYVFVGVRWLDSAKRPLWTEMIASNEGKPNATWQHLTFHADAPPPARFVSFCFFTGTYAGKTYRAQADNASLQ